MTPAARLATAAEILDSVLAGTPAERALLRWSRASRYAGSKDRAAVRDHVFAALRCRRSFAALGGSETGRGLTIGLARDLDLDLEALFSGQGHAPAPVTAQEAGRTPNAREALDCPDWLWPHFQMSLGDQTADVLRLFRNRAPAFLRVSLHQASRAEVQSRLAQEGIIAEPEPLSPSALRVIDGARRLNGSQCWREGLIDLQDAASQAVCDRISLPDQGAVLDYCAGGGGKALALAARGAHRVFAHDVDPARMGDIGNRAERTGLTVTTLTTAQLSDKAAFPLVVADVPCSGSGAWRRQPEGKWRLTPERLNALTDLQSEVLSQCARHVAPGGTLAYITCSLFEIENDRQIAGFLDANRDFTCIETVKFTPIQGGDGFFLAQMTREIP